MPVSRAFREEHDLLRSGKPSLGLTLHHSKYDMGYAVMEIRLPLDGRECDDVPSPVVPVRRLFSGPTGNNGGSHVFQSDQADHSEYRRYVGRRRCSRGVYAPRSREVHQPAGVLPRDGRVETGKRF